jgi:SSS family solute:Na+ symporter
LWWRINAWSELSSYVAGLIGAILVNVKFGQILLMKITLLVAPAYKASAIQDFFNNKISGMSGFPFRMTFLALFSTTIALIVTFLTRPCETEHLVRFYKRIKPVGPGWRSIKRIAGSFELEAGQVPFKWSTVAVGAILFYSTFFALGKLPLGYYKTGLVCFAIAVISGIYLWKELKAFDIEQ